MVERELKLHVPDDFVLPSVDGVAGLRADPATRQVQQSRYWDTADGRLLAHGVGLRWRSDSGWTCKSTSAGLDAGSLLTREEWTVAGVPEAPPREVAHALERILAGLPLAPMVAIETERTAIELRSSDGRPRVELVDDRVRVLDGPLRATAWRELELELRETGTPITAANAVGAGPAADATVLGALVARLRAAGAGQVVRLPKQLRALGVDTGATPGSLEAYQLAGRVAEGLSPGTPRAAGGVVLRDQPDGGGREVLAVHRPRYGDWCLPKGKQEPAESLRATAVREVEEETGLRCEVVTPLGCSAHRLPGGTTKTVWWWTMRVLAGAERSSAETDAVVWLGVDAAPRRLSHPGEREVLERVG
ncbi:MAG: hypothetical protein NVSMB29_10430 [Candidatus Dormibacteria bacterium]